MKKSKFRKKGVIQSTDHHLTVQPTNLTTHRTIDPPTHRSTNPSTFQSITQPRRFYSKDLTLEKYLFYRIQTQLGKCKTILRFISFLLNNIDE